MSLHWCLALYSTVPPSIQLTANGALVNNTQILLIKRLIKVSNSGPVCPVARDQSLCVTASSTVSNSFKQVINETIFMDVM